MTSAGLCFLIVVRSINDARSNRFDLATLLYLNG